jgi:hypothetical protein
MMVDNNSLLFERPWFPTVFRLCKENGIDWLRICAIAIIASGGDPRYRIIDWDFLHDRLGQDNPVYNQDYTDDNPDAELVDRATKWGLFQIYGQIAKEQGYEGRLVNLIDVTKNAQIFSSLMARAITTAESAGSDDPVHDAELALGYEPADVDTQVIELKTELKPFVEEFGGCI